MRLAELFNIYEIYDTDAELTFSKLDNGDHHAEFQFNNSHLAIRLQPITIPGVPELKNKRVADGVFFDVQAKGQQVYSTTNTETSNPSGIYGVVFNNLYRQFMLGYDALTYEAVAHHSHTLKEYDLKINDIVTRKQLKKYPNLYYYRTKYNTSDVQFLISKFPIVNTKYLMDVW